MVKGVRRSIQVYIFHALWMFFVIYKIFNTVTAFGRYTWLFVFAITTFSLINLLVKKYYMEVVESCLIIHQDYFRTKSINLNDIEKIEIEPSPFKSSYILLRDKTKVKFNDSNLDVKELKEAMSQFNIIID